MADPQENKAPDSSADSPSGTDVKHSQSPAKVKDKETEHGGPKGLEPTRYGDWEQNGRCTDF